jgi:DNA-binding transcriptional LysR family regulator
MDRLTAMEVFVRVAKLSSFSEAARELGMSTTAVSRYVKELENWLGVRLLNRTTRKLSLTDIGVDYLARSTALIADAEELARATRELNANPVGTLKISAPVAFGNQHMVPLLPQFMARYAELMIDLLLTDRFVDLVDEGYDVAIRITGSPDAGLIARKLAPCPLVLVAAPAYLERCGTPQLPDELRQHHCIIDRNIRTENRWPLRVGRETRYVKIQGRLIVNSAEAARLAACQGLGIAYIPRFLVNRDLAQGTLVNVLPDFSLAQTSIYAIYPHNRHLSAKVRLFVDYLKERFGDPPYWER